MFVCMCVYVYAHSYVYVGRKKEPERVLVAVDVRYPVVHVPSPERILGAREGQVCVCVVSARVGVCV